MKAKKVLAMLMASAMIMGTTVTAFAAQDGVPDETDTKDVYESISGIEASAQITAYRIIEPKYTKDGFIGYKWADGVGTFNGGDIEFDEDGQIEGLSDRLITEITSNATLLASLKAEDNLDDDNLPTSDLVLGAGTWILIVEGETDVYNPMIISVYYSESGSDSTMSNGEVDADDKWDLYNTTAYAKSTEITISKDVDPDDENAEVYSSVNFTITGTVPAYSDQYTGDVTYVIKDTFENGLTMNAVNTTYNGQTVSVEAQQAPTVYVGGEVVETPGQYTYTHFNEGDNIGTTEDPVIAETEGFLIEFSSSYIKTLKNATAADRAVKITYSATVTEEAVTTPGENKVELEYTHTPDSDTKTTKDDEEVYTVSFDGIAKKVGEGDADKDGLAGATFTLYETWTKSSEDDTTVDADELSDVVGTCVTSEDSLYDIEFKGLDADKTYYLTETAAPDGYSINNKVYTITFNNLEVQSDDTVTYEVYVDGIKVSTIEYGQPADDSDMTVQNTKLADLPSTGGMGTTIFTIGGCVIMVTAAGLYFATRKKEQK